MLSEPPANAVWIHVFHPGLMESIVSAALIWKPSRSAFGVPGGVFFIPVVLNGPKVPSEMG
jgi:hypothetical protein